jgi:hypothetical protein
VLLRSQSANTATDAQVKQAALDEAPFAAEEAWVDEVAQSQPAPPETEASEAVSDPTVTHAGLTEIDAGVAAVDGSADVQASNAPAASSIEPEAANAAAEAQWDKQAAGGDDPLSESFEMVPRDPAETENPHTTAPVTSTQSWADDTPEPQATTGAAPSGGDGFHEVHHNRDGRGRGRGGHQGEGRGGFRGRGRGGPRGDFRGGRGRGRGEFRGEFRGGRGGFRGAPRGEPAS